jgi:ribosomal protein S18 acetylase RimI-like enzyme
MTIEIRSLKPRDAGALARLLNDSREGWLWPFHGDVPQDERSIRLLFFEEAAIDLPSAWSRGRLVGFLAVRPARFPPRCAEFQLLDVHPDHRRGGVGRQLLLRGIETLSERGIDAARLVTWPSNRSALRLYEGVGFAREPRTRVWLRSYLPLLLREALVRGFLADAPWHEALEPAAGTDASHGRLLYPYAFSRGAAALSIEVDALSGRVCGVETGRIRARLYARGESAAVGDAFTLHWDLDSRGDGAPQTALINEAAPPFRVRSRARLAATGRDSLVQEIRVPFDAVAGSVHRFTSTVHFPDRQVTLATGVRVEPAFTLEYEDRAPSLAPGTPRTLGVVLEHRAAGRARYRVEWSGSGLEVDPRRQEADLEPGESVRLPVRLLAPGPGAHRLTAHVARRVGGRKYRRERVDLPLAAPDHGHPVAYPREGGWTIEDERYRLDVSTGDGSVSLFDRERGLSPGALVPDGIGPPFGPDDFPPFAARLEGDGPGPVLVLECRPDKARGLAFEEEISFSSEGTARVRYRLSNHSGRARRVRFRVRAECPWEDSTFVLGSGADGVREEPDLFDFHPGFEDLPPPASGSGWWAWEAEGAAGVVHGPEAEPAYPHLRYGVSLRRGGVATTDGLYLVGGREDARGIARFHRRIFGGPSGRDAGTGGPPVEPRVADGATHLSVDPDPVIAGSGRLHVILERGHRKPVSGSVAIDSPPGWSAVPERFAFEDLRWKGGVKRAVRVERDDPGSPRCGWFRVRLEAPAWRRRSRFAAFQLAEPSGEVTVEEEEEEGEGRRVMRVENGYLTFRVACGSWHGVIGIAREGVGQLHSSFPEPRALRFRDRWHGGVATAVRAADATFPEGEPPARIRARRVSVRGRSLGSWTGVEVTCPFSEGPLRGHEVSTAYLTLPGSPVLACRVRVRNRAGSRRLVVAGPSCYLAPGGPNPELEVRYRAPWDTVRRSGAEPFWIFVPAPWAAVLDPAGGSAHLIATGPGPRFGIEGTGEGSIHLSCHRSIRLYRGEKDERLYFLVFPRPGEDLEIHGELARLERLP